MQKRDSLVADLIERVSAGQDVLLPAEAGSAALDAAASALPPECRVVRIRADQPGLSLSGLMAQVAGQPDLTAHDDAVVELGYRRLAIPDAPGRRIVLMVGDAARLQRPALRFIQHVARSSPALVLVLAGGPALHAMLAEPDFAALKARLDAAATLPLAQSAPVAPDAAPLAARERLSSVSHPRRWAPIWAGAGLSLAASVALATWLAGPWQAPSPEPARPKPVALAAAPAQAPAPAPAAARAEKQAEEPAKHAQAAPVPPTAVPVLASPARAEPDRASAPAPVRAARSKPAEPRRARQARVARLPPAPEPEPDQVEAWGGPPPPIYGRPAQSYWAPRRYYEPAPMGAEGPYIGTYTADRYGVRTFHYGP